MNKFAKAAQIMTRRFGKDSLISLATIENGRPSVRTVNAYYEDGAFYIITYALSNKIQQIKQDPHVAVCGEWFTAHGIAEEMGYVMKAENKFVLDKLRVEFASWYQNGHIDEKDPHTCLLRVGLEMGILFEEGQQYAIDFINRKA